MNEEFILILTYAIFGEIVVLLGILAAEDFKKRMEKN
jgi:hypothetical protein